MKYLAACIRVLGALSIADMNRLYYFSREEMDRRIMMMVQVDEGLWNSLLELDALMQEKKSLASQLEEVTLTRYDHPVTGLPALCISIVQFDPSKRICCVIAWLSFRSNTNLVKDLVHRCIWFFKDILLQFCGVKASSCEKFAGGEKRPAGAGA